MPYKPIPVNKPAASLPGLTPERIKALRETSKGKMILQTSLEDFPLVLKSLENELKEKLDKYEQLKQNPQQETARKQLLPQMLEDQLYWEFARQMMFMKWREAEQRSTDQMQSSSS
ncbi:hypothetical protein ACDQ55_16065 [Chitinophaga sp. 30R24]|uniref:hypothetical protein n=1 Tax=Chitinophaga sp. 30R24 TaxID=3248838 RepID=UPI003B91BEE0